MSIRLFPRIPEFFLTIQASFTPNSILRLRSELSSIFPFSPFLIWFLFLPLEFWRKLFLRSPIKQKKLLRVLIDIFVKSNWFRIGTEKLKWSLIFCEFCLRSDALPPCRLDETHLNDFKYFHLSQEEWLVNY